MDYITALLLIAITVEPFLVLWVAPMLTQKRVKRDAVAIIDGDMMPRIEQRLRDFATFVETKLKETATFLTEEVPATSNAAAEMGRKGGEARAHFYAAEEAVLQAVQAAGPEAILKLEALKLASPAQYKVFIRSAAADPEAAIKKFGGSGQQQGVFL